MTTTKLETLEVILRAKARDLEDAQMAYQRAKRDYHTEEARLRAKKRARITQERKETV